MRSEVAAGPAGEATVDRQLLRVARLPRRRFVVLRKFEAALDVLDVLRLQTQIGIFQRVPFGLDHLSELFGAGGLDQYLDASAMDIVATAETVVDAQHGLEIGDQVEFRQELANPVADHRHPAQAAADVDRIAELAGLVAHDMDADIVDLRRRAIARGRGERDLELARQPVEFRVERGPLARQLAIRAGVDQFVARHAGQVVAGDVADAVAGGLDRVHFHRGQIGQDVRHFLQLRPVVLDVLACREVAVALVVAACDMRQHAELPGGEQAVWNRHPQHRREALKIQAVAQPQRLELLFVELAGEKALGLIAKLCNAFVDQRLVEFVVAIHINASRWRSASVGGLDSSAGFQGARRLTASPPALEGIESKGILIYRRAKASPGVGLRSRSVPKSVGAPRSCAIHAPGSRPPCPRSRATDGAQTGG